MEGDKVAEAATRIKKALQKAARVASKSESPSSKSAVEVPTSDSNLSPTE
jgi:hypothetical protein